MSSLKYLNVGCGSKFHPDWINVDMVSRSPQVRAHNLLKGIPFPDNEIDVIYHSQVLEHIPKEMAASFVSESFRVLKPGGTMRVVVPDLENIVTEYLTFLRQNLENPTPISEANYDWIVLEMYDQTVRNDAGGQMAKFLEKPEVVNEDYVIDRIGYVGQSIRNKFLQQNSVLEGKPSLKVRVKELLRSLYNTTNRLITTKEHRIGRFRLGGEIHQWMYDRYSLARLLRECGFVEATVRTPTESGVENWGKYGLDVKNGIAYDPTSLFMEAKKPI